VSPRYRGRVPKLSASSRGHGVQHEPGPHSSNRAANGLHAENDGRVPTRRHPSVTRSSIWWRGRDLNPRPSGYEPDGGRRFPSRPAPSRTSELGFRPSDVPVRTIADHPISARGVEESVEVPLLYYCCLQATWTASLSLAGHLLRERHDRVPASAVATRASVPTCGNREPASAVVSMVIDVKLPARGRALRRSDGGRTSCTDDADG
jgi:hypothetical protein